MQARPNPTSAGADVLLTLRTAAAVDITVYDIAGRPVRHLAHAQFPAGEYSVRWHGDDARARAVAPGVYVIHVRAGDRSTATRIAVTD